MGASTFVGEWVNVWVSGYDTFGSAMVDDDERAVSSVLITFGIVDLAGCMGAGMKINDWALKWKLSVGRRTRRRWWYLLDFCLAIVLYRLFELPFTTLQTFFLQTKMMKTQTPCKEIIWWMLHLVFKSGLPGTCSRCLWEPANEKRGQSWGSQSTRWFPCQGRDAGISPSCPSSRWCRHCCQSQNYEYVEQSARIMNVVPCHSFGGVIRNV